MTENYSLNNHQFSFLTTPGVFSQYGLDEGSKILLENLPWEEFQNKQRILDLGCGCGVIGIVAAKILPDSKVYFVDSDIRATRLTEENCHQNNVTNKEIILSDVVKDLPKDLKFDLVLSNPPTHQGREVLIEFLKGAYQVLEKGGEFYLVVNRMQSTLDRLQEVFGNSQKLKSKKGYLIFSAKK